jgi:hypothetical protein
VFLPWTLTGGTVARPVSGTPCDPPGQLVEAAIPRRADVVHPCRGLGERTGSEAKDDTPSVPFPPHEPLHDPPAGRIGERVEDEIDQIIEPANRSVAC